MLKYKKNPDIIPTIEADGTFLPLEDGYFAIQQKDNLWGFEHWDLSFIKDNKLMFHATLEKPMTIEKIKEEFEFYKSLIGGKYE